MANEYDFFGLLFVVVGIYFLVRPMNVKIVSGKKWKSDPEGAEETQKRRALYWGIVFIIWGIIVFFFAPSG